MYPGHNVAERGGESAFPLSDQVRVCVCVCVTRGAVCVFGGMHVCLDGCK